MYQQIVKNASQYIYIYIHIHIYIHTHIYIYIYIFFFFPLSNISQNFGEWEKNNVSQMSQDQHPSSDPKTIVGKTKETKRIFVQNSLPRFTVIHNISQSLKNYLKN